MTHFYSLNFFNDIANDELKRIFAVLVDFANIDVLQVLLIM